MTIATNFNRRFFLRMIRVNFTIARSKQIAVSRWQSRATNRTVGTLTSKCAGTGDISL